MVHVKFGKAYTSKKLCVIICKKYSKNRIHEIQMEAVSDQFDIKIKFNLLC